MALIQTKEGEGRVPGRALPQEKRRRGALGVMDGHPLSEWKKMPPLLQEITLWQAYAEKGKYVRALQYLEKISREKYLQDIPGLVKRLRSACLEAVYDKKKSEDERADAISALSRMARFLPAEDETIAYVLRSVMVNEHFGCNLQAKALLALKDMGYEHWIFSANR